MLRLLPDPLRIGLFSGESWIRTRTGETLGRLAATDRPSNAGLLGLLDAMLLEHKDKAKQASHVEIVASDALFSIVALPWQDELTTPGELENYARLKLEESLAEIDDGSPVQVLQRHFGALGFAYSVSGMLVSEAREIVSRHGFRLKRFAPLSAAMHSDCANGPRRKSLLALAADGPRVTAHLYLNRRLHSYEVEAAMDDQKLVILRLLSRTLRKAVHPSVVQHWLANPNGTLSEIVQQHFSSETVKLEVTPIPRSQII